MRTRRALLFAGVAVGITPATLLAQPRQVRVGMLASRPLTESVYSSHVVKRLEQIGYRRGTGMTLEYRYSGESGGYSKLARELGALNCDLIVNLGTRSAAVALREAQVKAPIVFLAINYDPVRAGVVKTLRTPGGNTTGVYLQQEAIAAKRLDVMREVLPTAKRFGVFSDENTREQLDAVTKAAEPAGITLTIAQVEKNSSDPAAAFESFKKAGVEAVVVLGSPVFAARWQDFGRLLSRFRMPGIGSTGAADAGFLLAYNADNVKAAARTAEMAARVLKGAKPAETPVEQADEFELVIDVPIARALGLKIPPSLQALATRVIQ